MFTFFEGASLKVAKSLIQVTGLRESAALFKEIQISNVERDELLNLVLALNACNLAQTMKEDFIANEIDVFDSQDIVDDYVVENLRSPEWIMIRDGAERMELCLKIMGIVEELQIHWISHEDPKGPGPRYFCVTDLLRRLGSEKNTSLHDALFEFMYRQHTAFIKYFRVLLNKPEMGEPTSLS